MEQRWASIMVTVGFLHLGILLLSPDLPTPFAFALVALALAAAIPLVLRFTRSVARKGSAHPQPSINHRVTPDCWQLLRPMAADAPGTVRSRAPSALVPAHN